MSNLSPQYTKNSKLHNVVLAILLIVGLTTMAWIISDTVRASDVVNSIFTDLNDQVASQSDIDYVGDRLTTSSSLGVRFDDRVLPTIIPQGEPKPLVGRALELKQTVGEPTEGKFELLQKSYCALYAGLVASQPISGWGIDQDEASVTDEQINRLITERDDLRAEGEFLYDKIAHAEFPNSDFPDFYMVVEGSCSQ